MARLLLFAAARDAAGTRSVELDAPTVAALLAAAVDRFGDPFERVLAHSRVWLDGEPATGDEPIGASNEVAVLPPVSGG